MVKIFVSFLLTQPEGIDILLDHYSKGGYAVSQLRNKNVKSGQQPSGLSQDDESFMREYEQKYGGQ